MFDFVNVVNKTREFHEAVRKNIGKDVSFNQNTREVLDEYIKGYISLEEATRKVKDGTN